MALARDLVELEAQLRALNIDPFSRLSSPEAVPFVDRVGSRVNAGPEAVLRLCLQALHIQQEELQPRLLDAELVATLPPHVPGVARPTDMVIHELARGAQSELILLGYELSEPNVVAALAEARARGVEVVVICDRVRADARDLLASWPSGVEWPRVYQDREREGGPRYASMHAKCLLADGRDLLITSANFTFHGLHGNIEVGVRLAGSPAEEARKIFSHLVESGILDERSRDGEAQQRED